MFKLVPFRVRTIHIPKQTLYPFSTQPFHVRPTLKYSNRSSFYYSAAVLITFIGLTYTAVPLYRIFCTTTGIGGSLKTNTEDTEARFHPSKMIPHTSSNRRILIRFNSDTARALNWTFKPQQRSITVVPGETALAFYTAKNNSDSDVVGISTYNVFPAFAAPYFNKIQCFCFEEQKLLANEQVDMPVFFFIDPAILDDPNCTDIDEITLSYTFFNAREINDQSIFVSSVNEMNASSSDLLDLLKSLASLPNNCNPQVMVPLTHSNLAYMPGQLINLDKYTVHTSQQSVKVLTNLQTQLFVQQGLNGPETRVKQAESDSSSQKGNGLVLNEDGLPFMNICEPIGHHHQGDVGTVHPVLVNAQGMDLTDLFSNLALNPQFENGNSPPPTSKINKADYSALGDTDKSITPKRVRFNLNNTSLGSNINPHFECPVDVKQVIDPEPASIQPTQRSRRTNSHRKKKSNPAVISDTVIERLPPPPSCSQITNRWSNNPDDPEMNPELSTPGMALDTTTESIEYDMHIREIQTAYYGQRHLLTKHIASSLPLQTDGGTDCHLFNVSPVDIHQLNNAYTGNDNVLLTDSSLLKQVEFTDVDSIQDLYKFPHLG